MTLARGIRRRAAIAGRAVLIAVLAGIAVGTAGAVRPAPGPRRAVQVLPGDARTLELARAVGFDTVVDLFSWRQIEPTRGEYHWQATDEIVAGAEYYGLDLVVRLDQNPAWSAAAAATVDAPPDRLADYTDFVRAVAARYRGRVLGYILWNEPNLASEWGGRPPDPAGYVALLKAGYQAVKAADPGALVVSAGLASTGDDTAAAEDDRRYLEAMYQAGAAPFFDVLGAHPYGFGYPPDDPHGAHHGLNMARLADLRAIMVAHGDQAKPIWATEMGWTVCASGAAAWQAVTEAQQADYLARAFRMAPAAWPWLGLMSVWNLGGERGTPWPGYSLLEPDGTPRPAYRALAASFVGAGYAAGLGREAEGPFPPGGGAGTDAQISSPQPPAPGAGFAAAALPGLAPARTLPESLEDALPPGLTALAALIGPWLALPAAPARYQVLAADDIVHLGHRSYSTPWVPLYGGRNPSTLWRGTFYIRDPGRGAWQLVMRLMQSNSWGNAVWINGRRLDPPFPPEDYSNSWVACGWQVPAGLLVAGPNEIEVTITGALPMLEDRIFTWDDLQFKDITLSNG